MDKQKAQNTSKIILKANAPIGVFDSGIGGLTVASGILKHLPQEKIIYFGDTAHMPYGDKSSDGIRRYCAAIADFLIERGCKMLVIACNSASAVVTDFLRERYHHQIDIVNAIDPIVESIVETAQQSVVILATQATTRSRVYPNKIRHLMPSINVISIAARSLATIIEEGLYNNQVLMQTIIEHYLPYEVIHKADGMALACTHYPIIREQIEKYLKSLQREHIRIFDSTNTVAAKVKSLLAEKQLLTNNTETPEHECFISDNTPGFEQSSIIFFGRVITPTVYDFGEGF